MVLNLKNDIRFKSDSVAEQFILEEGISGVLLYSTLKGVVPFKGYNSDWIILVDEIKCDDLFDEIGYEVSTHASYSFSNRQFYVKPYIDSRFMWGHSGSRDFYLLTKEQKKYFIENLNKCGYKFIKPLNKLIIR